MTLVPWLDRTNRHVLRRFEYLEPPSQAPLRLTLGVGALTFIGMLLFASYRPYRLSWRDLAASFVVRSGAGRRLPSWLEQAHGARRAPVPRFDPTSED